MGLVSTLFKDDPPLEACLVSDPSHILPGASGEHVGKIQTALIKTDSASIDANEVSTKFYGPSTALAVLNFKKSPKRKILNYRGQFDDIVGRKTMARLDLELAGIVNPTQKDLAELDRPLAESIVVNALRALTRIESDFRALQAGASLSLATPAWDAMSAHFHLLPNIGLRTLTAADIGTIRDNFLKVQQVLRNSVFTFRNGPQASDPQDAIARGDIHRQVVLFNPSYKDFDTPTEARVGPNSRAAILVHEAIHLTDDKSGQLTTHISEFDPAYDTMPADDALHNPSAYASFAWHVTRGFDRPRFGLGIDGRRF